MGVVAACGGDDDGVMPIDANGGGGDGGGGGDSGGVAILFADDMSAFPAGWTNSMFAAAGGVGAPAPSIACAGVTSCSADLFHDPFASAAGITFCVKMALENGASIGNTLFTVRSQGSGTASANLLATGDVRFTLNNQGMLNGAPITDGAFHEFCLVVPSTGDATWRRDGVQQVTGPWMHSDYNVDVRANTQDTAMIGRFDELRITRP